MRVRVANASVALVVTENIFNQRFCLCWYMMPILSGPNSFISAPIAQSSSTVAHQRFRTRFNISHDIDFIVRCAMLSIIWYIYLYALDRDFRRITNLFCFFASFFSVLKNLSRIPKRLNISDLRRTWCQVLQIETLQLIDACASVFC